MNESPTTPRVAIYVSALGRGGAERALLNLANHLSGLGARVDVIIANREQSDYLGVLNEHVRLIDLAAKPASVGLPKLIRYLRHDRPHGIIAFELRAYGFVLLARTIAGTATLCVANVQNSHSREFAARLSLGRRITLKTVRHVLPRMDRVVAVSEGVAADLTEGFGISRERIAVIFNPIVTDDIIARSDEPVADPWLEDPDVPVVLSVGRLTRQKNYPLLLRAFSKVLKTTDARLIVLGRGEEADKLHGLAAMLGVQEKVRFRGFVANPFAYMKRAGVFVLSSDWEGLPSVLIEALAVGCPIVSTDCPSGPREILGGGRYGRLVPVGDDEALATSIVASLWQRPDPHALRSRAQIFHARDVARQYLQFLSS